MSDSVLFRATRDSARLGVLSDSRLGRLGDSADPALERSLPLADVSKTLVAELDLDPIFRPICRGTEAGRGRRVDRHDAAVTDPARTRSGLFQYVVTSSTAQGRALRTASASPRAAGCARRCFAAAMMACTLGAPRRGRWCRVLLSA